MQSSGPQSATESLKDTTRPTLDADKPLATLD